MRAQLCLLAAVLVLVPVSAQEDRVLSRYEKRDEHGQFALQYLTPTGILVRTQGALKRTPDGRSNVLVQQGSYRYTSPEGIPVEVNYVADERGFRPFTRNLPTDS